MSTTQFQDKKGRTWRLDLTVGAVRRVKETCGVVDLYAALEGTVLIQLATDLPLFVDVLWTIIEPQAREAGVTDIDFGEAMAGEQLEAATEAFIEALAGFFVRPGQQAAIRAVAEKTNQTLGAMARVAIDRVNAIDPDQIAREIDQAPPNSSSLSGEPPASVASIPTHSPSDSSATCSTSASGPSGGVPVP